MAITIKQQPESYTPCWNPQVFVALSNQVAQPNFEYTVVVQDMISGESETFPCQPNPDDYLVFDASFFSKQFLTSHYLPKNVYGWQQSDSIRKIRVNIGETYGATPVYTAGSNIDFIVWNASLPIMNFPAYDPDTYVYRSTSTTNLVFLTSLFDDAAYPDRSNYHYVLTAEAGDVLQLNIDCYDQNGFWIQQSVIDNPYQAVTTYTDKYLCIDVGLKGLANINSGLVTGSYPIIPANCYYYEITDRCITGAASTLTSLKKFYVKCEPRFTVYTVHFLADNGRFETIHFPKYSERGYTTQKTTYARTPYTFDASAETYTYERDSAIDKQLTSIRRERLKLTTDWLSEQQVETYREIMDSPLIYLDQGSSTPYYQLRLTSQDYTVFKRWNSKLPQLTLEFELAHSNSRQG